MIMENHIPGIADTDQKLPPPRLLFSHDPGSRSSHREDLVPAVCGEHGNGGMRHDANPLRCKDVLIRSTCATWQTNPGGIATNPFPTSSQCASCRSQFYNARFGARVFGRSLF